MPTKNKFKPMKTRFRATFAGAQLGDKLLESVDKENEVLHGVQITLEGEALGHGVWLDREFCEAIAAAGNATGDVGVKVRYGHPAMCSDAIGTELARAKNFRVVDLDRDRSVDGEDVSAKGVAGVLADIYILKSAHSAPQGDIAKHVMETAAEDPKQFGQSIVFTYADWVVKDKDGVRHSYREEVMGVDAEGKVIVGDDGKPKDRITEDAWKAQSADGKEYAVLGKFLGTDFTDTPAATDGIFSTGTLAERVEDILAENPEIMDVLEKSPKNVMEFLERTGLDKRLESVRVAGLQAAKDKEIAELRVAKDGELAALQAEFDAYKKTAQDALEAAEAQHKEALGKKDEEISKLASEVEGLKSGHVKDAEALAARGCESVEQLCGKLDETTKALSETKAALDREVKRYREQVGAALAIPGDGTDEAHGLSRMKCSFVGQAK